MPGENCKGGLEKYRDVSPFSRGSEENWKGNKFCYFEEACENAGKESRKYRFERCRQRKRAA